MKALVVQSHDWEMFERALASVRVRWPEASIAVLVEESALPAPAIARVAGPVFRFGAGPSGARPVLDATTREQISKERFDLCALSFDEPLGVQYWGFRQVPLLARIRRVVVVDEQGRIREYGPLAWWGLTLWECGLRRALQPALWIPSPIVVASRRYCDYAMLSLLAVLALLANTLTRLRRIPGSSTYPAKKGKKPTLVIFIPFLCLGGAQRALVNWLRQIERNKYTLHVCALRGDDNFFEEDIQALGLSLTYLPCKGQYPFWKIPWNLARFFRAVEPDAVLGWLTWATVFTALAGSMAGVPRVVVCYRNQSPDHSGQAYPDWVRPLEMISGRLADVVLANSRASGRDYGAWARIPPRKIVTVYNGIDAQRVRPLPKDRIDEIRSSLGVGFAPLVGVVGRLSPEKDHDTFFQAMRVVRTIIPTVQAVLLGNGNEGPRLRALARDLGIADCVTFLGARKDALEIMGSLDVLALTSRTEGLPNVLLEAQAMEIPVVTTDAGGAPEVVREGATGYIVPVGDGRQVADRVVALLQDEPLRRRMGAAGRAYVAGGFGADQMAAAVLRHCGL